MSKYSDTRHTGTVIVGGRTYARQAPLTRVLLGNATPVAFSIDEEVRGRYAIIDADELQPSHLGASQNPLHFIPEAQPRNRSASASGALTPERIARNLRPDEILYGSTAYTGAPVVNQRGEVIQGNGRGYAVKLYYKQFPNDDKGYQQAIERANYLFGFVLYEDVLRKSGIKRPVLVRMIDVTDKRAIQLGQFTQADTEAIASGTTKIKSKARLLTKPVLKRILNELTRNDSDDKTLAELIRESKVLNVLIREEIIRPDDLENYTRNGVINETGVDFISSLLLNALFRGADVNTSDVLTHLPMATQNAIKKSTIYLLKCADSKGLNQELGNAILGYREYLKSGIPVGAWINQMDLSGQSPRDRFTALELAMVKLFNGATTQKEVVTTFRQYAQLVNDQPGDMFSPARKGLTKRAAVEQVFKVQFEPSKKMLIQDRTAKSVLRRSRNRTITKRRSAPNVAPQSKTSSTQINTNMTTEEKKAFSERMAKARAKKAKASGSSTKKASAKKPTATKKAASTKKTKSAKKATATKPKKKTSLGATVKSAARGLKKVVTGRRETVTKKATTARTTTRVKSAKQQKGANFIQEVDKLANRIHKRSATGKTVEVPVYKVSRSQAKRQAFKALGTARRTKNISNIRLKA